MSTVAASPPEFSAYNSRSLSARRTFQYAFQELRIVMNHASCCALLSFALSCWVPAQEPTNVPQNPTSSTSPADKQQNAASATKDNSGTTGDQITKPAGAKGS